MSKTAFTAPYHEMRAARACLLMFLIQLEHEPELKGESSLEGAIAVPWLRRWGQGHHPFP